MACPSILTMRLRVFFGLIIIYVIAAFGWLTYSLINFSNNEYVLKEQILKAGKQACVLNVIERAKAGEMGKENTGRYFLRQIEIDIDTQQLNEFLTAYNYGSYIAEFLIKPDSTHNLDIKVSETKKEMLKLELAQKKRLYFFEAILLTILVGAGIYGVYSSVRIIYSLNKQQNNFLLSVTHELKTPIASMKLMLQTIQRRKLSEEKHAELVNKAIENSDRLNELTEKMLTAMQIENKRYTYGFEVFSLSDMVESMVLHYQNQVELKAFVEEGVNINGDPFILRISINNLVENAIKYGDEQPIEIRLHQNGKQAVIIVKDLGNGIPENQRKRIFKKFYRIEDEEVRDTKGTGLGLYIVKQTIEKHGGKVEISNNSPHGSIFTVSLPIKKMSSP
ncbi:MAG: signal transduction histidine kinase [Bacteroidia bacterium]|jgi:signal transduction histidine kinase